MDSVKDILKSTERAKISNSSPVMGGSDTNIPPKEEEDKKDLYLPYLQALQKSLPPRYPDLRPDASYLEMMQKHKKSFIFTGGVGTGKTRKLLQVLLAYFMQKTEVNRAMGTEPAKLARSTVKKYFLTVTDVLRKIKDEFDHPATDGGIMERMIEADLLFLDDLGAEKASEWVKEQLYTVINERYNWMRPTLITTNLNMKEIADCYGDRMASRLVEMCEIVKFDRKDWRVQK